MSSAFDRLKARLEKLVFAGLGMAGHEVFLALVNLFERARCPRKSDCRQAVAELFGRVEALLLSGKIVGNELQRRRIFE